MDKQDNYIRKAKVLSVYDGDTFTVLIDLGLYTFRKVKIRLHGLDCPEIRNRDALKKEKGLAAKKFVKDMIEGKEIIVRTIKAGKYAQRWIAEVFIQGKSLNKMLLDKKYAKIYHGGKR